MINPIKPDYTNTPVSKQRPKYCYKPKEDLSPLISVITPYYNTGSIFWETYQSILGQSFAYWEWILVDDGSTDESSLQQLEQLQQIEPRATVIHASNGGPGVARNIAAKAAQGKYLLQLDSDDLIEPTYMEKTLWFLETNPQFAACNSYVVSYSAKNYLWSHGFHEYEESYIDNRMTNHSLVRKEKYFEAGGYDPQLSYEHADWDFWLNLAEIGEWGYTIEEFLAWYRINESSLLTEIEGNKNRAMQFKQTLHKKHAGIEKRFPTPTRIRSIDLPFANISLDPPIINPLMNENSTKHILLVVPWLETGGADKFNLDMIKILSTRGYSFTIATTKDSLHPWLSEFANITPDIFCMHNFINRNEFPCFLSYLVRSRNINTIILANSELGYLLLPYLRWKHPSVTIADSTHMEEEYWLNGGYPAMSIRAGNLIDLNIVATSHLKDWMVQRGAPTDRIKVVHCNIDTNNWNPLKFDKEAIRKRLQLPGDKALILFIGRMVEQKRPLVFGKIIQQLANMNKNFLSIVIGDGPDLSKLKSFVRESRLSSYVQFDGVLPNKDIQEYMAVGDILILPSDQEGLALVIYESMSMGLVPVVADVGGHSELVTSDTGFLVHHHPEEVAEYARILSTLIEDKSLRTNMVQAARTRVVEHFDLQNMADDMEQAFCTASQRQIARGSFAANENTIIQSIHQAIEYVRVSELADVLWGKLHHNAKLQETAKDRFRNTFMPYGSKRYEVYKRIRLFTRKGI